MSKEINEYMPNPQPQVMVSITMESYKRLLSYEEVLRNRNPILVNMGTDGSLISTVAFNTLDDRDEYFRNEDLKLRAEITRLELRLKEARTGWEKCESNHIAAMKGVSNMIDKMNNTRLPFFGKGRTFQQFKNQF